MQICEEGPHLARDRPGNAGAPGETDQWREWPPARVVAANQGERRTNDGKRRGEDLSDGRAVAKS